MSSYKIRVAKAIGEKNLDQLEYVNITCVLELQMERFLKHLMVSASAI